MTERLVDTFSVALLPSKSTLIKVTSVRQRAAELYRRSCDVPYAILLESIALPEAATKRQLVRALGAIGIPPNKPLLAATVSDIGNYYIGLGSTTGSVLMETILDYSDVSQTFADRLAHAQYQVPAQTMPQNTLLLAITPNIELSEETLQATRQVFHIGQTVPFTNWGIVPQFANGSTGALQLVTGLQAAFRPHVRQ